MMTRAEAIDMFNSDDLIGIGMEADALRRKLHPEGVVSYIIDRNINYTNFCTEYCSFCAFYRPMGHAEGYVLPREVIFDKIQETIDLGGTGILFQGGLHPDLKICCGRSRRSSISGAIVFRLRRLRILRKSAGFLFAIRLPG
jgi:cyclic dehypoxanthinyl futalosine synthase